MFHPCHKNKKKKKNNPHQKTLSQKVDFDTEDPSLVCKSIVLNVVVNVSVATLLVVAAYITFDCSNVHH